MSSITVSVVIRTYNEQRHLKALLSAVGSQRDFGLEIETVLVDSGSTDDTLKIAAQFPLKIVGICKQDFSFGRSLNLGCAAARGEFLVIVSGHCVPTGPDWISKLIAPFKANDKLAYVYGGQIGDESSHFSERRIFAKYFPVTSCIPQEGFYCNNANAALRRAVWEKNPFDEELTGLEDLALAKALVAQGYLVGYVAEACVYHLHSESWGQVRNRFEREAVALGYIMPEFHLRIRDIGRYFVTAVVRDARAAFAEGTLAKHFLDILRYRYSQFSGSYHANQVHRRVSNEAKEAYFYPD